MARAHLRILDLRMERLPRATSFWVSARVVLWITRLTVAGFADIN
jgi:hypothetical protein